MEYYVVSQKQYGTGDITEHRRNVKADAYKRSVDYLLSLTPEQIEQEKKRVRTSKSKSNFIQRAMSTDYSYFFTLTSNRLKYSPNIFMSKAKQYLDSLGVDYIILLEICPECKDRDYHGNTCYHIHGMCKQQFDLTDWARLYCNNNMQNLYCSEIRHSQFVCALYMSKDYYFTKESLPKGFRMYKSNNKKVDTKDFTALISEDGEIIDVFKDTLTYSDNNNNLDNNNDDLNNDIIDTDYILDSSDFNNFDFNITQNKDWELLKSLRFGYIFTDFITNYHTQSYTLLPLLSTGEVRTQNITLTIANYPYFYPWICFQSLVFTEVRAKSSLSRTTAPLICARFYTLRVKNRLSSKRIRRKRRKLWIKKPSKDKFFDKQNFKNCLAVLIALKFRPFTWGFLGGIPPPSPFSPE